MKTLINRHPVAAYFILAFGWTWLLVFALIFSGAVKDISKPTPAFIITGLLCNVAPSIAAFIVTRVTKGKEGTRRLRAKFKEKQGGRILALTLIPVPAVLLSTTLISHFTIRQYSLALTLPLLFIGLVWPLFSSFGEEFGWRGFILPRLLKRLSPLKAGLLLGLIWSVWHIPMDYIAYKDYGAYMLPAFLVSDFINLTLQSVLMTYIYTKSGGSLRLMVLFHYLITASAILPGAFLAAEATPRAAVLESLVSVGIFFLLAAVLYLRDRKIPVLRAETERA